MVAVIVRQMRAADVPEALDLLEAVAAEGIWLGTEPGFDRHRRGQYWLEGLSDPMVRTLVLADPATDRLVGQGSMHVARYGVAELGMNLAADSRGRGLGGQLLDALLDAARELGAHKAELQVWPHNERAIRLYLSRGFVVEGRLRAHYRRASGQVWDALLMGCPLDRDLADGTHGSGLPDAPCLPTSPTWTPGASGSVTRAGATRRRARSPEPGPRAAGAIRTTPGPEGRSPGRS